jgi:AbrB family looped-hinge helix DNA binding protein
MTLYEIPMQENGRVVLPVSLRKALGLEKGDKVLVEAEGNQVTLTTARLRRKRAQEIARRYAQAGVSVVEEFLQEKRAEALVENDVASPAGEKAGS